jgi:hypothetical protein
MPNGTSQDRAANSLIKPRFEFNPPASARPRARNSRSAARPTGSCGAIRNPDARVESACTTAPPPPHLSAIIVATHFHREADPLPKRDPASDEALAALDLLCAAAAPGPWRAEHLADDLETFAIVHRDGTVCAEQEDEPGAFDDEMRAMIGADFAFIAAARTTLPALVAEVRRLRGDQPIIVERTR